MSNLPKITIYTDGGSRGNPGPSAIGIVLCADEDKILREYSEKIGECTNNQTEYWALIKGQKLGFEIAQKYPSAEFVFVSDSELMIKQLNGEFKIKHPELRELCREVRNQATAFKNVKYLHVKRGHQFIKRADQILNDAQDGFPVDRSYE